MAELAELLKDERIPRIPLAARLKSWDNFLGSSLFSGERIAGARARAHGGPLKTRSTAGVQRASSGSL